MKKWPKFWCPEEMYIAQAKHHPFIQLLPKVFFFQTSKSGHNFTGYTMCL